MSAVVNLEAQDLMKLLPHRYPFLLIDRILQVQGDESAIGIKAVSVNEPFFQGHFPSQPIMPGVLIVEAMAQTSGAIVVHAHPAWGQDVSVYFMSVDRVRFRQPVLPGQVLNIHVKKVNQKRQVWKYQGTVYVDDKKVAEACYSAMVQPKSAM